MPGTETGADGGCWEPDSISQRNAHPGFTSIDQFLGIWGCPSFSLRRKKRKKKKETYLYKMVAKRPGSSPAAWAPSLT